MIPVVVVNDIGKGMSRREGSDQHKVCMGIGIGALRIIIQSRNGQLNYDPPDIEPGNRPRKPCSDLEMYYTGPY